MKHLVLWLAKMPHSLILQKYTRHCSRRGVKAVLQWNLFSLFVSSYYIFCGGHKITRTRELKRFILLCVCALPPNQNMVPLDNHSEYFALCVAGMGACAAVLHRRHRQPVGFMSSCVSAEFQASIASVLASTATRCACVIES